MENIDVADLVTQSYTEFPFDRVTVCVTPDNLKIIEWYMQCKYPITTSPIVGFHIEYSRGGEWIRITEEMITDMCVYVDEDRRRCGMGIMVYYRVVAVDGNGVEHASKGENMGSTLSPRQWRLARDILRKEYLRMHQLEAGVFGYLLKKRQHGDICAECVDHDLEEVINSKCPVCFGNKYKGGYYNAIPYYMDLSGTSSSKDVDANTGVQDNQVRQARAIAYPQVETYDVWVSRKGNRRFVIRKVDTIAQMELMPLIYRLTLMELAPSATQFKVPLVQDMEEIHEDTSDISTGGWTGQGITQEETW